MRFVNLNPEARAALNAAVPIVVAAIESILPKLRTEMRECPACGLKVAISFSERQAHEVLSGILHKLRKL
jgi:hypothetical protein